MSVLPWHLLPDNAAVGDGGHLTIAGCDTLELAREFGTPGVRLRRGPSAGPLPGGGRGVRFLRHLRHQGVPVPGHGPTGERGGHGPRRGQRWRVARLPGGRGPGGPDGVARQQQVGRRAPAGQGGRRRPDRDRQLRRARPARGPAWRGRALPPRCCCGSPPASKPRPTSTSPPARTTPSSASPFPPARRWLRWKRRSHPLRSIWSASTPTSAPRCSGSTRSPRRSAVLGEFANPLGLPELVVGGGLGVPYVEGEEGATITQWAAIISKAVTDGRHQRHGRDRAGTGHRRRGGDHALHRRHGQGAARHPHLRVGGRRDERQSSPRALRIRL